MAKLAQRIFKLVDINHFKFEGSNTMKNNSIETLLDLDKNLFFDEFYQVKPFLIKRYDPIYEDLLPYKGDLLSWCQEKDCESRLIFKDNNSHLKVLEGPLKSSDLLKYKDNSTTFIYSCENFASEFQDFKSDFYSLFPHWIIDDVMTSLSAPHSSVGAHFDPYDVFIYQVDGKRVWTLSNEFDPELNYDHEIKNLKSFLPKIKIELGPGDLLYIPSGWAHEGKTKEEHSFSLSLGLKDFSTKDCLLKALDENLSEKDLSLSHFNKNQLTTDFPLELWKNAKELALNELEKSAKLKWSFYKNLSLGIRKKALPLEVYEEKSEDEFFLRKDFKGVMDEEYLYFEDFYIKKAKGYPDGFLRDFLSLERGAILEKSSLTPQEIKVSQKDLELHQYLIQLLLEHNYII